ncbi:MAG: tRNA pseudouridine(55) synthase TruB [Treponema sp.]|jgi:tRNA pseudouridine55 synthase|nr:tRNA pseudouridine(55) synthase TruB [Treponema sp.]
MTDLSYLLLNKRAGLTSFETLSPIKKIFNTGKVCHTGTLDKFARGLLVVLIGRTVKLSSFFLHCDKTYRTLIHFGDETDTLDPEGTVIASAPPPPEDLLAEALDRFRGTILQAPPLYSAIHVDGRRAWEIARSGGAVEMKKRPVTIYGINLLSYKNGEAELEVSCSAGTYLRSLARDIALAARSRAYLKELTRSSVGPFLLDEAVELPPAPFGDPAWSAFKAGALPVDPGLFERLGTPVLYTDRETSRALANGKNIESLRLVPPGGEDGSRLAVFERERNTLAALIRKEKQGWTYAFVGGE